MPFASTKQRKFMHMKEPKIAEKWEHEAKGGLAGMVGKKLFGKKKKKMAKKAV